MKNVYFTTRKIDRWLTRARGISEVLSRDRVNTDVFRLMTEFTGLFDTARDYTLQFAITHIH
jgi:hypothetical protein